MMNIFEVCDEAMFDEWPDVMGADKPRLGIVVH